jgi:hypothetical protein
MMPYPTDRRALPPGGALQQEGAKRDEQKQPTCDREIGEHLCERPGEHGPRTTMIRRRVYHGIAKSEPPSPDIPRPGRTGKCAYGARTWMTSRTDCYRSLLRRFLPMIGAWRSLVSAPVWGTGGREFKSLRSDQFRRVLANAAEELPHPLNAAWSALQRECSKPYRRYRRRSGFRTRTSALRIVRQ